MDPERARRRIAKVEEMKANAEAIITPSSTSGIPSDIQKTTQDALEIQKSQIASLIFNAHRKGCIVDFEHPCTCGAHEFADIVRSFGIL